MGSRKEVFSSLIWKFAERFGAQLITFAVSVVLARLLSPADYGIIVVILIFINIGNVLVTSGFGNALIQKKDSDNIDFSSVFFFQIIFSILLYAILYIIAPYIADYMGDGYEVLSSALRVLGLMIPLSAVNNIQQAYVSKNLMFKKYFFSTLAGTIVSAVVGIWLAYTGAGIWALVAQYLANNFVNTIILWFTIKWRPQFVISFNRLKGMVSFGWKIMASELINSIYNESRGFIIGKKYSSADLAYYNKGQQMPSILVTNINASIQTVLFPVVADAQNDVHVLKSVTRRAIKTSTFIMAPLLFGLAAISDTFILVLLTDKWMDCSIYLRVACFMFMFYPLGTANLQVIKALGKGKLYLTLEIIKKIIGIAILLLMAQYGPLYIAYGALVSIAIESILNYIPNRKLINYKAYELLADTIPSVLMSTAMYFVVAAIELIQVNSLVLLFLQIICGAVFYIIIAFITKNESFRYLTGIIFSKKKGECEK